MVASNKELSPVSTTPLLIVIFLATVLFYLLRPPILLFSYYGIGKQNVKSQQGGYFPTKWGGEDPAMEAVPTHPPNLPESLTSDSLPERWQKPVSIAPETQSLNHDIFQLTLNERSSHNLSLLAWDEDLSEIATRHSVDMLEQNYISHTSQSGDGPAQRVGRLHRRLFGTVSENIASIASVNAQPSAYDTLGAEFVDQWMNSLGHRRNILASESTRIGVGCANKASDDSIYISHICTQLFADAYAYSDSPIPLRFAIGASLNLRLLTEPGFELPKEVLLINLGTGKVVERSASSVVTGKVVSGSIKMNIPPAPYSLGISIPDRKVAGRSLIVQGPHIILQ